MKIELTEEERQKIVKMMETASVPLVNAEEAIILYKKFKEAKE